MEPKALIEELHALTQQLVGWRLEELESDPGPNVRQAVRERLSEVLPAAKSLFGRVLDSTLAPGGRASSVVSALAEDSFLDQLDRSVEEHSNSAAADIAFIAKLEIQGLEREVYISGRELDGWRLLELCERVRRHVVKATTALRRTLGSEQGIVLGKDEIYVTELVRSIRVRRRYAIFRKQVEDAGATCAERPLACMRMVGTSIAILVCRPEYRDFRIGDRMLMRSIQKVLLEYLGDPNGLPQTGQRIWQDVLGALEIMKQVNRRPELLEHDHIMLEALEARLEHIHLGDDPSELLERAQSLLGRDEELDRLVHEKCLALERWRPVVTAARLALEQHRAPTGAHDEIRSANEEAARSGLWSRRASQQ